MKDYREARFREHLVQRISDGVIGEKLLNGRMQFQAVNHTRGKKSASFLDTLFAAIRINAGERNRDVRIFGGEFRHTLIRYGRPATQSLIHCEHYASDLARPVVVSQGALVVRYATVPKILLRGPIRRGFFAAMLDVHVNVDGGDRIHVNGPQVAHGPPSRLSIARTSRSCSYTTRSGSMYNARRAKDQLFFKRFLLRLEYVWRLPRQPCMNCP